MIGAAELAQLLDLPAPTTEQAAIVEASLEPTLVIAGAGSGKTETMAARVVYLVANELVRPDQILGLTFTRKAAAGLAQRIRRRLARLAGSLSHRKDLAGAEPEVWTYHAFGGRIIAEFGPLAGIEPRARVLTPTAAWQLARSLVTRWDGDLDLDLRPEQVTDHLLALSGALADHLCRPAELDRLVHGLLDAIRSAPPGPRQAGELRSDLVDHVKRLADRATILPLVDAFAAAKAQAGVIDFADQMRVAANLVGAVSQVGAALRDRHRVVLLDEYQDTGHAQRVILRTLFGAWSDRPGFGHPVTAVGDPVQSIYSWRGASASNLPRFVTDFPGADGQPARSLTLSTSFRNAVAVLAVANEVSAPIRDAPVAVRPLRPRSGAPHGDVRVGLFPTVDDEDRWVASIIAAGWADAAASGSPPPSTAVLLRRRRDMDDMASHLRAAGLPVEVVGLGGLLAEPEVADVVAVLRLLVDADAGDAVIRVLTGARWRIGLADLSALYRRAQELVVVAGPVRASGIRDPVERVRRALIEAGMTEDVDRIALVDALADPGPPTAYSELGYARLVSLGDQLRRLRSRVGQPLPDLVAEVERLTGLDIEVLVHGPAGRAHLDAFADVVADLAASGAGLTELLEYLATAQEREDGLAPGEVEQRKDRVQVMTIHAAKGLEWDVVAVPHLTASVFPTTQGRTWLSDSTQLPPALRGDRADLPRLDLPPPGADQREVAAALSSHVARLKEMTESEERRLLYVALTRAAQVLLVSGHHWGRTATKALGPSPFLLQIRDAGASGNEIEMVQWSPAPTAGEQNPLTAAPRRAEWPQDPLGDRRPGLERAAGLVRAAGSDDSASGDLQDPPHETPAIGAGAGDPTWSRDVDVLLAELNRSRSGHIEVALPGQLSVTGLVDLAADPEAVARRLFRPTPRGPSPGAERGEAFHTWLERRFTGEPLLDIAELPGASDAPVGEDERLAELRSAFLDSQWAARVPQEIELPFSMALALGPGRGVVRLRGRVDAVFADPDGGYTVVDWKTGRVPGGRAARAAAVQLAVYRLAVADLLAVPLSTVRAAFVYVAAEVTVAPVDLLDRNGLLEMVTAATSAGAVTTEPGGPESGGSRPDPSLNERSDVDLEHRRGSPGQAGEGPDMARSSA